MYGTGTRAHTGLHGAATHSILGRHTTHWNRYTRQPLVYIIPLALGSSVQTGLFAPAHEHTPPLWFERLGCPPGATTPESTAKMLDFHLG